MGTLRGLVVKLMADSSGFISGLAASTSATASAATQISGSAGKIGSTWAAGGAQAAASQQKMALEAAKLNNEIEIQSGKLNNLRARFGETNPQVEKSRLNIIGLKLKLDELNTTEETTTKQTKTLGEKLGDLGGVAKTAFTGIAAASVIAVTAIAGVGAAAINSVKQVTEWADSVDAIGDVLGTNASDSAAISVAIRGVGGNVENITTQMAFLSKGLVDADGKLGSTGQLLQKLGINALGADGNLRGATEILTDAATALDAMPDGLQKSTLMMQLFGKSGKDMSDTMHALANGGLESARKKAQAFGLDLGEEGVQSALSFKRGMADLQMMVQGFSVSIGSRLLPVLLPLIQSFVQWAVSVLPRVQTALSDVGQFVSNLAQQAQTGKGVFGVLQTSISSVISWVVANLQQISATIQNVLAGISVVVNTIIVPIVNFVISQFEKVISWVVANWPLISQTFTTVLNAIKSVFDAVIPVLAPLVEGAFTSIKAIVETVINIVLGVIKTAMQILNGDWAGAWQTVQQTVIGIFEGINQFFGGIPAKLLEFGKQMIDGLVLGILSNGDKVIKALRGLIDQAIADVKKILGLGGGNASPAYQAGANVAQNINAGYAAALKPLAAPAFARANTPAYGAGRGLGAGGSAQDASASKQIVIPIYLGGREVERYIVDVVKQTVERERGRYG
jgi:hypothetical protein